MRGGGVNVTVGGSVAVEDGRVLPGVSVAVRGGTVVGGEKDANDPQLCRRMPKRVKIQSCGFMFKLFFRCEFIFNTGILFTNCVAMYI